MRRVTMLTVACLLLLIAPMRAFAQAEDTAPVLSAPDVEAYLKKLEAGRERVQCLKAKFEQRLIAPDGVERRTGTIVYVKPRRLVVRYDKPVAFFLVDDRTVYQYDADLEELEIMTLEDDAEAEALFLGFEQNLDRLREAYELGLFTAGGEAPDTQGLSLRPKDPEAGYFERVWLYLRDEDFVPTRIEIRHDAESMMLYTIGDIVKNPEIRADDTQIHVPEGVEVTVDQRYDRTIGPGGEFIPEPLLPAAPAAGETNPGHAAP